ncbi:MAG TPA: hypothetical protein VF173_17425 [Thermoanaerobaculia bacterium]|nr:hypothetical protein [Thermoanaerobaculia bacterium]
MSGRGDVVALLDSLYSRGVRFELLEGDSIALRPRSLVTPEEMAELREGKAEALAILREVGSATEATPGPSEATPPAPRIIRVYNPARAPLCRTPGCSRLDVPMLRTVRKLPAWICPGCWATCAVSGEDPPEGGAGSEGGAGRGRRGSRPRPGVGSDPAATLAVPGGEVSSAGATTTGPADGVPAMDGNVSRAPLPA